MKKNNVCKWGCGFVWPLGFFSAKKSVFALWVLWGSRERWRRERKVLFIVYEDFGRLRHHIGS